MRANQPRFITTALVVCLLLAGCLKPAAAPAGSTETPLPVEPLPDASSTPLDNPASPTLVPQDTPGQPASLPDVEPRPLYLLNAQLDYNRKLLKVDEQVTYTNTTSLPIPDLTLDIEPNLYLGAFQMEGLHWGDGTAVTSYTLEYNRLWIGLPQPLLPQTAARLSLSYTLALPAIPTSNGSVKPQPFGYTSRQTNLVDWYAFFPPYQADSGWQIHGPWYFGEHQVYQDGDFDVEIQVSNAPPGATIAASALPEKEGDKVHYRLAGERSFAWSIGPEYKVFTQTVGTVTVLSYAFPYDVRAGQQALKDSAAALALYSRLFGPYPHPSLSVVEADFRDGMEYDGLIFLSYGFYNLYDGTPKGYLTAIAAHETAHQWWFGLVGNDQLKEPWLDESMATYSERLFYENVYPDLLDWWWATRVNFYQPQGFINQPVNTYNGYEAYRNAVYLHGAQFFEALRKKIGDPSFFAFLKDYAARYSQRQATADGFFAVLADHTQMDLRDLMQTYFRP
jgi:hypothetical protein